VSTLLQQSGRRWVGCASSIGFPAALVKHRCYPALLYHLQKDRVEVRFVVYVFMLELKHVGPPLARSCWYDQSSFELNMSRV
jgi:hypothetical protein